MMLVNNGRRVIKQSGAFSRFFLVAGAPPLILSMEKTGPGSWGLMIKSMPGKFGYVVVDAMKKVKKIGEDDPRRIVHSMKVALALTLVSLFYYFRPLYDGFGQAGMSAVLTVVVVFEFTVGGTLSKGINRGCATLLAGALGVGAEYLASFFGDKAEPFVLGLMVFCLAAASTFTRFFPNVKKKYDYGVLIFILTFSLVAISGFRVTEILELAHHRLSTILIGAAACVMISMSVCPVWAGQDLHDAVVGNIEKLAAFLEGFGSEYFSLPVPGDESGGKVSSKHESESSLEAYKTVLNSKATEEVLANFASWEPSHGRFRFRHPWKQYLKLGALARECACLIETLNRCINSKSQTKVTSEFHVIIRKLCIEMSTESGKALRALAAVMKSMTVPSSDVLETHAQKYKAAADELKSILGNSSLPTKADLQELMPVLVVASVLIDIIKSVEQISSAVHELSLMARFKTPESRPTVEKQQHRGDVKPVDNLNPDFHVIEVRDMAEESPEIKNVHPPDCDHVAIEVYDTCGDSPEIVNVQRPTGRARSEIVRIVLIVIRSNNVTVAISETKHVVIMLMYMDR
ncbi:Aluminum-activated malate transporter 8 [Sesamum alatum]|uniref:Aluminum-activated malate transporter 8 n=1 Tax=Sesamum alatum TaxID=300844 RepID=A0AAE2CS71_9LAMI|nr:Aluminum-activated malate transporter 8 [Sesamum alatum]